MSLGGILLSSHFGSALRRGNIKQPVAILVSGLCGFDTRRRSIGSCTTSSVCVCFCLRALLCVLGAGYFQTDLLDSVARSWRAEALIIVSQTCLWRRLSTIICMEVISGYCTRPAQRTSESSPFDTIDGKYKVIWFPCALIMFWHGNIGGPSKALCDPSHFAFSDPYCGR